jgi:hypothetical protein
MTVITKITAAEAKAELRRLHDELAALVEKMGETSKDAARSLIYARSGLYSAWSAFHRDASAFQPGERLRSYDPTRRMWRECKFVAPISHAPDKALVENAYGGRGWEDFADLTRADGSDLAKPQRH